MIIISHRGNIDGPNPLRENSPDYIDEAISLGFDVEVDVRVIDKKFYLGHDDAQHHVSMKWLVEKKDSLWIHCKNVEALDVLSGMSIIDFHYFWHDNDKYTLTSKGMGWVLVGQIPFKNSIIVLPELVDYYCNYDRILNTKGICTDKPLFYQNELGVNK